MRIALRDAYIYKPATYVLIHIGLVITMSESEQLAFRRLVDRWSLAISKEERVRLVYLHLYYFRENYKDASSLEVLSKLETDGKFGISNLDGLQEIAKDIDRKDLEREAKEFAKRKSKTKSKRPQEAGPCNPESLSDEDKRLRQTLEVTIAQMTVFMRQVELLKEAIGARTSQRAKVSETMHEASQTAEKLASTLNKAFCELKTGGVENSGSETSPEGTLEHSTREEITGLPRPVQEQYSPRPSPKPRPKHKPSKREPASPLLLQRRKIYAQETEACTPMLEGYKASVTHSPIAVRHGVPILPPPLSPKPAVKMRPCKRPQQDTRLRSSPPVKPKSGVKVSHSNTSSPNEPTLQGSSTEDGGELRDYEVVLGAGDYTGGSTGDSGFGEAELWKQHMTKPPADQKGTTEEVHYYKSLQKVGVEEEDYTEVDSSFN